MRRRRLRSNRGILAKDSRAANPLPLKSVERNADRSPRRMPRKEELEDAAYWRRISATEISKAASAAETSRSAKESFLNGKAMLDKTGKHDPRCLCGSCRERRSVQP